MGKQRGSDTRLTTNYPKERKTKFDNPLQDQLADQLDTGESIFTIDGRKRSKTAIPIGGSSFRDPQTTPTRTDDKTPINAGWVNSGYDQSDAVVPQPTAPKNGRGFSKYSGDSGVNSGLSDYISRMDPGRISSRRWRESVTDYRM